MNSLAFFPPFVAPVAAFAPFAVAPVAAFAVAPLPAFAVAAFPVALPVAALVAFDPAALVADAAPLTATAVARALESMLRMASTALTPCSGTSREDLALAAISAGRSLTLEAICLLIPSRV